VTTRRYPQLIAGWFVLTVNAGGLLASPSVLSVDLMPGFDGVLWGGYSSPYHMTPDSRVPFTIEIENRGEKALSVDLFISIEPIGGWLTCHESTRKLAAGIPLAPGARIRKRLVDYMGAEVRRRITATATGVRVFQALDIKQEAWSRVIVAVDEERRKLRFEPREPIEYAGIAHCRSAYLPEDPVAYNETIAVILGDDAPSRWDRGQIEAIEDYVRRGGKLILNGGDRSQVLSADPIVRRWLSLPESRAGRETEKRRFRVHPFGLGTVLRSLDDLFVTGEGPAPSPAEAPDAPLVRFFEETDAAAGGFWLGRPWPSMELAESFQRLSAEFGDPRSPILPVVYLCTYVIWMALGARILSRTRTRLLIFAIISSIGFSIGIPLLFDALAGASRPATIGRLRVFMAEGKGLDMLACAIRPGGRADRPVSVLGRNVAAYPGPSSWPRPLPSHGPFSPPVRDPSEATFTLDVSHWETGSLVAFADATHPPPLDIRAMARGKEIVIQANRNPGYRGRILTGEEEKRAETEWDALRGPVWRGLVPIVGALTFAHPYGIRIQVHGEILEERRRLVFAIDLASIEERGSLAWVIDLAGESDTQIRPIDRPPEDLGPTSVPGVARSWISIFYLVAPDDGLRISGPGIEIEREIQYVFQVARIEGR